MNAAIIANPIAGRGRAAAVIAEIRAYLQETNRPVTLWETEYPGHAIQLAKAAARDHSIVAGLGGDGTVGEVLKGILGTRAKLGVIGAGTGNDYGRSLNIPKQPRQALDVLFGGVSRPLDVVVERDKVFACSSGIGFPTTVLENVNAASPRASVGKLAYITAIFKTIKDLTIYPYELTIDGRDYYCEGIGILIMNLPYGGSGMLLAPDAKPDDGMLSVVMIGSVSRWNFVQTLPKIFSGTYIHHPQVSVVKGRTVIVQPAGMKKMFDGDVHGVTPYEAEVQPSAIEVMVTQA